MLSRLLLLASMLFLSTLTLAQELTMPQVFGDHMVLQRQENVRLWGSASPETAVNISIDGKTIDTQSDENGAWEAFLPPFEAGGPYKISVESDGKELVFADVLFGDVWLAGGQSNMEWQVGADINNMEAELNDADYPEIRFIKVAHDISVKPLDDWREPTSWKVANKENARDFSAVAWFFAKRNHLEKNVPVGIIDDNWGGTPAEAWTPTLELLNVEGYKSQAAKMLDPEINWDKKIADNDRANTIKYERVEDQTDFLVYGAHQPDYDDEKWDTVTLPNTKPLSDFIWLRKTIRLDEVSDARLNLGNPGKFTVIFVNGTNVYSKIWSDDPEVISIDRGILNKGENVIAIRTVEDWNNRTFIGKQDEFWLETARKKLSLEGEWKYSNTVEPPMPEVIRYEHQPGTLFNAMIHPVAGYTIQGAIWYQGESNVGQHQHYHELFSTMIDSWREEWRQGDFPFLFVQLANYQQRYDYPTESDWAKLQEAQTQTLELANTGMAVTIDIGEANDIHPRNKQDVGNRLWLAAKHVVFNDQLVYSGPKYRGHVINGRTVELTFDHTGSGLKLIKEGKNQAFAIAGTDGRFFWAEPVIMDNRIVLSSDQVPEPVAVRYAWADNPNAPLYNLEGLPAIPFRTDDW